MYNSPCNRNISHSYLTGELSMYAVRIAVIELFAPFDIFVIYYMYVRMCTRMSFPFTFL